MMPLGAGGLASSVAVLTLVATPVQGATLANWQFDPTRRGFSVVLPAGVTPRYLVAAEPARIILELPQTQLGPVAEHQAFTGAVSHVRLAQYSADTVRVVLELAPGTVLDPHHAELTSRAEGSQTRWTLTPLVVDSSPIAQNGPALPPVDAANLPTLPPPTTRARVEPSPVVAAPPDLSPPPSQPLAVSPPASEPAAPVSAAPDPVVEDSPPAIPITVIPAIVPDLAAPPVGTAAAPESAAIAPPDTGPETTSGSEPGLPIPAIPAPTTMPPSNLVLPPTTEGSIFDGPGRLSTSAANLILPTYDANLAELPDTLAIDPFSLGAPEAQAAVSVPSLAETFGPDAPPVATAQPVVPAGTAPASSAPTVAIAAGNPLTTPPPTAAPTPNIPPPTIPATNTPPAASPIATAPTVEAAEEPAVDAPITTAPPVEPVVALAPDEESLIEAPTVATAPPEATPVATAPVAAAPAEPLTAPPAASPAPSSPVASSPVPAASEPPSAEPAPADSTPAPPSLITTAPSAGSVPAELEPESPAPASPVLTTPPPEAGSPTNTPGAEAPTLITATPPVPAAGVESPDIVPPATTTVITQSPPFLPPSAVAAPSPFTSPSVPAEPIAIAAAEAINFGQPLPGGDLNGTPTGDLAWERGAQERRPAPDVLLPAGTVLQLRYTGELPLELAGTEPVDQVLLLETEIRDPVTGSVVAPVGSQVVGQFQSSIDGQQWLSQVILVPAGSQVPFTSRSEYMAGVPQVDGGGLALGTGIGAVALTMLTGFTGIGLVGGAVLGATAVVGTAPQAVVIEPYQIIEVQVVDDVSRSLPVAQGWGIE